MGILSKMYSHLIPSVSWDTLGSSNPDQFKAVNKDE